MTGTADWESQTDGTEDGGKEVPPTQSTVFTFSMHAIACCPRVGENCIPITQDCGLLGLPTHALKRVVLCWLTGFPTSCTVTEELTR